MKFVKVQNISGQDLFVFSSSPSGTYSLFANQAGFVQGGTYTFNYPSAHPLRFSTTSDGTHGGGSEYTSGVSTYGNSITITVAANAPTLYYYCQYHSGMGGQINTT